MAIDQAPTLVASARTADSETTTDREPAATPERARGWLARPLAIYVLGRLVALIGALPAIFHHDPGGGPWPDIAGGHNIVRVFARWDGAWYIWLAERGYPDAHHYAQHLSDVSFFPLFPLLIKAIGLTGVATITAATIAALFCSAGATVFVWLLANRMGGRAVADRATLLFVLFPGAFVLSLTYAEPLMLLGSAACLYFLLDRRWVVAGLFGAVATATRPNGIAIALACAVVAGVEVHRWWRTRRTDEPVGDLRSLAAPVLAFSGIGTYFVYLAIRTQHLTAWFQSERMMWHDHIAFVTPFVRRFVGAVTTGPFSLQPGRLNDLSTTLGVVLLVGGFVVVWKARWPLAIKAYTFFALLIPSLSDAVGPRPRMLLAAFPLAIWAAERLSRRNFRITVVSSAFLLVGVTYLVTASLAAVP